MQIFDNPDPIVTDDRYFIYNRICQIKLSGHLGKKYKHIHLYIFNDGLLWCSKRGQFKKGFKFINTNLLYGVPENSNSEDATMFIQYGSRHKNKKKKNKKKKNKHKSNLSSHPQSVMNESKENLEIQQSEEEEQDNNNYNYSMQINHGKPTKKTILVFVNEQARDQCLQKIKQTQTKYLKRLQRQQLKRRERQKLKKGSSHKLPSKHPLNKTSKTSNSNKLSIHDINNEQSLTLSHTEESSIFANHSSMENSSNHSSMKYEHMLSLKPLESHKQYSNTFSTTINSSAITSNTLLLANEQSDDTDNIITNICDDDMKIESGSDHPDDIMMDHSKSSTGNKSNHSIISHSNNSSINNNININITPIPNIGKGLKQSVSTEITTIKEEDEDDVKKLSIYLHFGKFMIGFDSHLGNNQCFYSCL